MDEPEHPMRRVMMILLDVRAVSYPLISIHTANEHLSFDDVLLDINPLRYQNLRVYFWVKSGSSTLDYRTLRQTVVPVIQRGDSETIRSGPFLLSE